MPIGRTVRRAHHIGHILLTNGNDHPNIDIVEIFRIHKITIGEAFFI